MARERRRAGALLALLLGPGGAPRALAEECFCSYGENRTEPLWTCSGGFRQYRCLRKARQGRWTVARGMAGELLSPEEFCSAERTQDACVELPPGGLSLHYARWSASANLSVQVACPASLNCTGAVGYLSSSAKCDGAAPPAVELPPRVQWITVDPVLEIPSPTHADLLLAKPFGFKVAVDDDALFVLDPWYHRVWTFLQQADGVWSSLPAAAPLAYPAGLHESGLHGRAAAGGSGAVFGGELSDALPSGASPAEEAAWRARGQTAVLFPRGAEGSWGAPVVLEGPAGAAGFGIAVSISGDVAIVGSQHAGMHATAGGVASIFERRAGTWNATPTVVIQGYSSLAGFGGAVAVDGAAGVAVVGSTLSGAVHVFERTGAGWSGTAAALLASDALPVGGEHPPVMAVSGAFVIIGAPSSEKASIFERLGDGSWTLAAELKNHTTPGSLFGSSVSIADRGGGRVVAVVGAVKGRRAFVFERSASSSGWQTPEELLLGNGSTVADGFGRSVAVSNGSIVVGSNVKKVYVYTEQVVGLSNATHVSAFHGPPPAYTLIFDARKLGVGVQHVLCVDFDGDGSAEDFKDVGLRLLVARHGRSRHTEEL